MANAFDSLCDILPGKDAWRIKVRVARMWQVPSFLKPDQANTVEMVLIDEKVIYFFYMYNGILSYVQLNCFFFICGMLGLVLLGFSISVAVR